MGAVSEETRSVSVMVCGRVWLGAEYWHAECWYIQHRFSQTQEAPEFVRDTLAPTSEKRACVKFLMTHVSRIYDTPCS